MSSAIDLHIHTNASDGTDSPREVLGKALDRGVRTISVTDHDTIDGALSVAAMVPAGVRYIRGIEFSCVLPRGKCHILGYGYDPADPVFLDALETGRRLRRDKLARRLAFLEENFSIILTAEELSWLHTRRSPGKPHLGRLLVDRGLAPDLGTAIRRYIDPCGGDADRISAEIAIRAILHAGGIPVWAHPLGGEGERRLTRAEFDARLKELTAWGIRGLECWYSRYDGDDIAFLMEQARIHGLLVSGGSDYHGANKAEITLGMLNTDDHPVDDGVLTILPFLPIE